MEHQRRLLERKRESVRPMYTIYWLVQTMAKEAVEAVKLMGKGCG